MEAARIACCNTVCAAFAARVGRSAGRAAIVGSAKFDARAGQRSVAAVGFRCSTVVLSHTGGQWLSDRSIISTGHVLVAKTLDLSDSTVATWVCHAELLAHANVIAGTWHVASLTVHSLATFEAPVDHVVTNRLVADSADLSTIRQLTLTDGTSIVTDSILDSVFVTNTAVVRIVDSSVSTLKVKLFLSFLWLIFFFCRFLAMSRGLAS